MLPLSSCCLYLHHPLYPFNSAVNDVKEKMKKKLILVLSLGLNDFKSKYKGSALGALWAVAEPLATVAVYWFVYTMAVGGQGGDIPYYLWLSAGIAPWFFIAEGIRTVTVCYRDYSFLLKKTPIDKSTLPTARMFSAFISHLIFLAIVIVLCIIEGKLKIHLPSLCAFGVLSMMLVWSVGSITAVLCAKHKGVANAVGIALNAGFWLTPVFWNAGGLDSTISKLVMLNPAAIIVEGYRYAILYGKGADLRDIAYLLTICALFAGIGYFFKKRELPYISDSL